ncbi:MAG: HNH endonuclease [Aulosira sp. ZfuVER01]|nr:HNH endonuclease signature motif containing protein [Aulosira sp. ZfuVER01]MDZ8000043.1 HNH endonuclease signature motif containing protein [Aulosira sp. DedVER01a]MDZ8056574.1 HNH endonuclease signature motif containing protein [Aulosira sp. ZfuCHP01]
MLSIKLYLQIKQRRQHPNLPVYWWRRQPPEQWERTRQRIYKRDRGLCQSPSNTPPKSNGLCMGEVKLRVAHIDHIRPLSSGGSNHASNLRTLCPVCHALRLDKKHDGMRNSLVKKGLIPVNWKQYVWHEIVGDRPIHN